MLNGKQDVHLYMPKKKVNGIWKEKHTAKNTESHKERKYKQTDQLIVAF